MPVVSAREILLEAARCHYAIGAFNVTNLVQMEGVIDAAVDKQSPVILQISVGSSQFLGAEVLVAVYRAIASTASVPICLNLNHCHDLEYGQKCAASGYTSIMIDSSALPYDENVRQAHEMAEYCHKLGSISVEGILDAIGGEEPVLRTDPHRAVEFVEATGVDLFAPAVGTAHGGYKTRAPQIDFERLARINENLNGGGAKTPLVIHGGTGLTEDAIKQLIGAGGAAFNVSTELGRILIDAQYDYISANRQEYEPARIDVAVRDSIRKAVGRWIHILGSAGKV